MRSYRRYFSDQLHGVGLDIGALHRPMFTHAGMTRVDYVDRFPVSELKKHYPELSEYKLTEANIIDNAETLSTIPDNTYDFVVSAHVLEHMRSPLLALNNWWRILKPLGLLYLIVPDHQKIFDKDRERTTLNHLIIDYWEPNAERDWQHYLDYSEKVDKQKGDEIFCHAADLQEKDYSIHFHCFIPQDIKEMLEYFHNNHRPIEVISGPMVDPADDHEIHTLIKKGTRK